MVVCVWDRQEGMEERGGGRGVAAEGGERGVPREVLGSASGGRWDCM